MPVHALRALLFFAAIVASLDAFGADLYVIADPRLKIDAQDVREIYLGEQQFAGPIRLKPVHNAAWQDEFTVRALAMEAAKYATWWTKKAFRDGLNPPAVRATDHDVIEYVRHTPGAIGYIGSPPTSDVLLVQIFFDSASGAGAGHR